MFLILSIKEFLSINSTKYNLAFFDHERTLQAVHMCTGPGIVKYMHLGLGKAYTV